MPKHTCRRCGESIDTETEGYSTTLNSEGEEISHAHSICHNYEEVEQYEKTGDLTGKVLIHAAMLEFVGGTTLRQDYKDLLRTHRASLMRVKADNDAIHANVKVFEKRVWFNGLQKFIKGETRSGHSCEFEGSNGKVLFRSLAMCGRWRATIEGPNGAFIDVLTEENCPEEGYPDMDISGYRMGINGICATREEAIALLDAATTAWAERRLNLEVSDVRILGT